MPIPLTLFVTFSNGTGACTCLNGLVVSIINNLGGDNWDGDYDACGKTGAHINLSCVADASGGYNWAITGGTCDFSALVPLSQATCQPINIPATNVNVGSCCLGTIDITITQ